jgi:hypothetical protein
MEHVLYVLNNPLRYIDPNGEAEVDIQFRAFIPQANVGGFRGDNRGFSGDRNASLRVSLTMVSNVIVYVLFWYACLEIIARIRGRRPDQTPVPKPTA